ncbi:exopolysaccharide transport family protein [Microbaculum marinum]|uniref:Exopolysaccharide transport family protein n=1 Tax=Microbaculum marinum TaxID=1764581 RepID=A0AAW9RWE4_9HYPH
MSEHSTYAGTQPAGEAGAAPGVPVGGMMAALWRARAWIVVPVILASAAAVLWLSSVTPLYRSTSKILVENQETAYTRPSATTEERVLLDQESIKSQVQLILSGDLSRLVIRELDLASLPEFNPDGGPSLTSRILSVFGVTRDPSSMTNDERVLDRYYERLVVYQVDTSRVIAIEFSSEDPELAARVANAIADGYIEMQKTAKRDATTEASDWLRRQVDSLRDKVNEAERKVDEFRTENGLFSTLRGTAEPQSLSTQQLTELTTQLALARAQKAEAQAKARLIREMLDSGRPVESSEVLNSPLIQNLVAQQVTLRAQIAELSMTLGPRHPRMQELNAQLGDLRQQIREEATKYSRAAENDAAVAAEREQDLLASVDSLETGVAESNRAEVELRALERDAKSQRDLLELLLARYRDATAREDLEALPADARIISRAAPASSPYFPKTLATLLAAFLGSLILSCGIVITLELVRSANAYPGVGPLPTPIRTDDADVPAAVPGEYRVIESRSRPALAPDPEALGSGLEDIRDEIVVRSAGEVGHTVLFTAVRRIGGLQATAMRLARSIAAQGRRVVVVDTEFAEQRADDESDDVPGLGDLLSGATDFEEAIQRDKSSRVHVISAGQVDGDPLILLASGRMDTVLEALKHTYDVVILLAPAVIRHGEARLLAPRADQAVLLLTGSSGDSTARRAQDRLLDAGLVNVALLHVDGDQDGPRLTAA